jgi:uncharacterized protein (TIGR02453 family)
MSKAMQDALDFLVNLKFNNSREWFQENREGYEAATAAVEDLVRDIIRQFALVEDLGDLKPKDCLFRMNRDVRFSKDKSPYKTNFGIVIGKGGRKGTGRSYYLNVQPEGQTFVAAGECDPSPEQLKAIRAAIAKDP